jgi:hypothetical protein
VIKYRPFFVTGDVQQPGKYDYQPSLTVLQAVSIAQGVLRAENFAAAEREIVTTDGDLRQLSVESLALNVKAARLAAEVSESEGITYPSELIENPPDPRIPRVMQEEKLRFDARREALKAEIEAIEKSKVLLRQELASLELKTRALDHLSELSQRELKSVGELLTKGLTVAPRQLAAESNQVAIESNRLDLHAAALRAQQSLARADRDIVELRARYRKEALDDMVTTRVTLDQIAEKMQTSGRLLQNAKKRSYAFGNGDNSLVPTYELTRLTPTGPVSWIAEEKDVVRAGDVLRVSLSHPSQPKAALGAGPASTSTALSRTQLTAERLSAKASDPPLEYKR